jgi:hypothetical protein
MSDDSAVVDRRARRERLARVPVRRAREAEAIAEGGSDVVYHPSLTSVEREAPGLDLGFFADAPTVERSAGAPAEPVPLTPCE